MERYAKRGFTKFIPSPLWGETTKWQGRVRGKKAAFTLAEVENNSSPNQGRQGGVNDVSDTLNDCLPTPTLFYNSNKVLVKKSLSQNDYQSFCSAESNQGGSRDKFPRPLRERVRERGQKCAFTLAEVLITLGIIGVVAAMTMPVLINNIKYHSYDNAKRKVLNSIGEAGRLLAIEGELNGAADAEDFVKNRLAKKMSIAKFCDSAHLTDCGLPSKFLKTDGKTEMSMPTKMMGQTAATVFSYSNDATKTYANKNSYGFVTGNGYSVNLFYNGACEPDKSAAAMSTATDSNGNPYKYYYTQNHMCFFAIYDMNGKGGPNVVGKDIGLVGVYYPNEETRAVAALPADYDWSSAGRGGAKSTRTYATAPKACDDQFGKDYRLPDRDELALMAMAGNLHGITADAYWSGSVVGSGLAWLQHFGYGHRGAWPVTYGSYVRCVRK